MNITNSPITSAARAALARVARANLLLKLALLTAVWACPGFGQEPYLDLVKPCVALASGVLSDSPSHGSGKVKCEKAKLVYATKQKVHAVTVEIEPGKRCKVELWKNSKIQGKQVVGEMEAEVSPPEDPTDEANTTFTVHDVQNLIVACRGNDPKDECKYRITQITEDGAAPPIPPKK